MNDNDRVEPDTRPSTEEVMDSLTGFDEMSIEKAFGKEILVLAQNHQLTFMRALIFVLNRRAGIDDAAARKAAMDLSLKDTKETFADPPNDVDPEDPDSDQGKGVSLNDSEPTG